MGLFANMLTAICRRAINRTNAVSAVILSNQGARHFDTAPATLDMLPAVVDAVSDRVEVIFDSGIRRGTDILKAVALGATALTAGWPVEARKSDAAPG